MVVLVLSEGQAGILENMVMSANDCGPLGEEWQSDEWSLVRDVVASQIARYARGGGLLKTCPDCGCETVENRCPKPACMARRNAPNDTSQANPSQKFPAGVDILRTRVCPECESVIQSGINRCPHCSGE